MNKFSVSADSDDNYENPSAIPQHDSQLDISIPVPRPPGPAWKGVEIRVTRCLVFLQYAIINRQEFLH